MTESLNEAMFAVETPSQPPEDAVDTTPFATDPPPKPATAAEAVVAHTEQVGWWRKCGHYNDNANKIPMPKGKAAEAVLRQLALDCLKVMDPKALEIANGIAMGNITPKPRPEPEARVYVPATFVAPPPPLRKQSRWRRFRRWLGQFYIDLRTIKHRASFRG